MLTVAFRFGANQQHELVLKNYLLGFEKYYVDGNLVLSHWSLIPNSSREFTAFGHQIKVQTAVKLKRVQMDGYVDGKLIAPDLFADFNKKLETRRAKNAQQTFAKLAAWMGVGMLLYFIFRFLEQGR